MQLLTYHFLKKIIKILPECVFVCMRDEKVGKERVTCQLTLVALEWVEGREIGDPFVLTHLCVACMHSHVYYK